jgi:hypothetical protein
MKPPNGHLKDILGHESDRIADLIRDPWRHENPIELTSFRMKLLQPDLRVWRLELLNSEIIEMVNNG